jgi:hypothetical protein
MLFQLRKDSNMKVSRKSRKVLAEPTPGSFQGSLANGVRRDDEMAVMAVKNFLKPVGKVAANRNLLELVAKLGLKRGAHNLIYRDTPEGIEVYEKAKALIDAFVESGRLFSNHSFHIQMGKMFGYTDAEITEFLNRTNEDRKRDMARLKS